MTHLRALKKHVDTCRTIPRPDQGLANERSNPGSPESLPRALPMVRQLTAREWAYRGRIAWQNPQGDWQAQEIPLALGKEVFDAEPMGVCRALELAIRIRGRGPVMVLLDSCAAIGRLQHQEIGSGQGLALQAHVAAKALKAQG